jgi:hypothetical protein
MRLMIEDVEVCDNIERFDPEDPKKKDQLITWVCETLEAIKKHRAWVEEVCDCGSENRIVGGAGQRIHSSDCPAMGRSPVEEGEPDG